MHRCLLVLALLLGLLISVPGRAQYQVSAVGPVAPFVTLTLSRVNDGYFTGSGQSPDGNGHVTFYVEVDDPHAALDKIEQLGGKTVVPVTEMEMVTFALFADPEGHVVGVVKGQDAG